MKIYKISKGTVAINSQNNKDKKSYSVCTWEKLDSDWYTKEDFIYDKPSIGIVDIFNSTDQSSITWVCSIKKENLELYNENV